MADESILSVIHAYFDAVRSHGVPVELGVLFGSQARDQQLADSDIDLLVVSPRFDEPRSRRDIDLLWRIAARVDSRIEPFPCGSRQWREDRTSPLLTVVREHGEPVAA